MRLNTDLVRFQATPATSWGSSSHSVPPVRNSMIVNRNMFGEELGMIDEEESMPLRPLTQNKIQGVATTLFGSEEG